MTGRFATLVGRLTSFHSPLAKGVAASRWTVGRYRRIPVDGQEKRKGGDHALW